LVLLTRPAGSPNTCGPRYYGRRTPSVGRVAAAVSEHSVSWHPAIALPRVQHDLGRFSAIAHRERTSCGTLTRPRRPMLGMPRAIGSGLTSRFSRTKAASVRGCTPKVPTVEAKKSFLSSPVSSTLFPLFNLLLHSWNGFRSHTTQHFGQVVSCLTRQFLNAPFGNAVVLADGWLRAGREQEFL
jgi:hypothetical protein